MQDALPAQVQNAASFEQQPAATDEPANLFLRHDTILGVCQGLGEEFGVSPTYFRLVFAGLFYFSPLWVVGTYVLLGLGIALARWLAPAQPAATAPRLAHSAPPSANESSAAPERLAA
jgi:phage shock protein PspC (stress-responsive transcriptional regulator)